MRLRIRVHALSAAVLLLVYAAALSALEVPRLAGRVNDYAGIISPETESIIESSLAGLELSDSTQVVVLTMKSIDGAPIEEFGIKVAEQWKIGLKGLDNGAILIVALEERTVRIEVGRGLEGKLTDLMSGRIIRHEIVPLLKKGDFDGGILAGVNAIVGTVKGEYVAPEPKSTERRSKGGSPAFMLLVAFFVITSVLGGISKILGGVSGAVGLPLGALLLVGGISIIPGAILAVVGFLFGLMMSSMPRGSGRGGFSSGGFGGFGGGSGSFGGGGFSGGGGGFGGGGASGSW
ncbi:MAG TPA: TPM domain-containing protein [Spirochaetota bacterium]|nr:TPM domain-containing protein [Spirochaetota bacterium]